MNPEKEKQWNKIAKVLTDNGHNWKDIENCRRAFDIGYMTGEMDERFRNALEKVEDV